jgi:hypothetical protein
MHRRLTPSADATARYVFIAASVASLFGLILAAYAIIAG